MVIDRQAALGRIDNDEELYREVCGIFVEEVPSILEKLKLAVNNGDTPLAARHAHSLKSSSSNIGAMELFEAAKSAEASLSSGSFIDAVGMIASLEMKLKAVLDDLRQDAL